MNKQEFNEELRKGLSGLPKEDIEERIAFYNEMIDDRMEEGMSEEDAVCDIGTVDELTAQIISEIPFKKIIKERITPKRKLSILEIVLLILGFPVWGALLIALLAVVLSVYISLWAFLVSLWSAFAALIAGGVSFVAAGILFTVTGKALTGIAVIGAGFVSAGLSVFMFFVCKTTTKGILVLTKKFGILIKNCFIKKEEA